MLSWNVMLLSVIFGAIWTGYFIYWKKIWSFMFIISWIVLMGYTFVITTLWTWIWVGLLFTILPILIKK